MFERLAYLPDSDEPVSVAEARLACRLDDTLLDSQLLLDIESARDQAEHLTGRFYRGQILRGAFSCWPSGSVWQLPVHGVSAVAIHYRSAAQPDDWTALDPAQIRWAALDIDTRIERRGTVPAWPELAPAEYGSRVRVELTVGPAAGSTERASVRRYILAQVASWQELPAAQRLGAAPGANPLFERLLDGERLWR